MQFGRVGASAGCSRRPFGPAVQSVGEVKGKLKGIFLNSDQRSVAGEPSTLNLRIKPEERGLIDRAAKTLGKNRTDFVLDAARRAAEDALLDRTVFTFSPKAYAEFLARLNAPPQPNARLRQTMQTSAPWE
jgi:uncharacterized protein (DUF1778 family)